MEAIMINRSISIRILALIVIGSMLVFGLTACSNTEAPEVLDNDAGIVDKSAGSPNFHALRQIQERNIPVLMADPDVVGVAMTLDEKGKPAILMMVASDRAFRGAPATLDGVKVIVQNTGRLVAMKGKPGGGGGTTVDHQALQSTPIQMGTSGGWRHDLANGYCCGGTLGSLIQVGNDTRILSNYHVFEADIIAGGNGTVATTGDPIVHPALIDIGCVASNGIDVATLVVSGALPGNNVDCSSANVISGQVDLSGAILEIGTISSAPVAAFVNQAVKKSGRTTGLGRAKVTGLNATVSITYENECAGGTAFTKTFTGQIVTDNKRSRFLAGGDSGSLMVEDVTTNPHPIGLLFAGSNRTAIANPIGDVLSFYGATMVGN
jgi:hypothetical protein